MWVDTRNFGSEFRSGLLALEAKELPLYSILGKIYYMLKKILNKIQ